MVTISKLLPYHKIRTSIPIILFHICIRISVIIRCYMNTISDKQKEMDFFYRSKKFVYSHDFVIFFGKIVYDQLDIGFLDSNVYLYEKDYYKCSNHNLNEFYTLPILQKTPSNLNLECTFHPI